MQGSDRLRLSIKRIQYDIAVSKNFICLLRESTLETERLIRKSHSELASARLLYKSALSVSTAYPPRRASSYDLR
ncbi:MAG TPA: hypothetical protein VNA22_00070 [Pyrinomonadaceae bacterium]|nr:hypothetical protein [Pyrinomonadaceae bacterium]